VQLFLYDARLRALVGDERLSAKKRGKDGGKGESAPPPSDAVPGQKTKRRSRSSDLGRALRTVYDDTLRESVPDDFMDLLGKLR
jgi:hypothetical protein